MYMVEGIYVRLVLQLEKLDHSDWIGIILFAKLISHQVKKIRMAEHRAAGFGVPPFY